MGSGLSTLSRRRSAAATVEAWVPLSSAARASPNGSVRPRPCAAWTSSSTTVTSSATSGPTGPARRRRLRLLMGLTRATAGASSVLGLDAWTHRDELHRRVGYVPGDVALYPRLTGQEHVDFVGHLHGLGRPPEPAPWRSGSTSTWTSRLASCRVATARSWPSVLALMIRPELLVLDEPSSGLDPLVQREFHALLAEHVARAARSCSAHTCSARSSGSRPGSVC